MIQLNQNEFLANLCNLVVVTRINKTVNDIDSPLVRSCMMEDVPYGDSKLLITVDTLEAKDYSKTSSLLTVSEPTVDEQELETTDKKFFTVTLNRYLLKGAFANEYSMSDCIAVILSMLQKSKGIYLYKKVVSAYENWTPTEEGQTLTIDLIDTTNMTGQELYSAQVTNAKTILKGIQNLYENMTAPTRKYNDLQYETFMSGDDYKLILNSNFSNLIDVDALATLLNSSKITDKQTWRETYIIPSEQFANSDTKTKVIGWLGDREKYQISPRFEVATSFSDGSNLMDNNWLHFWLISGMAKGLNLVKIVANFVAPAVA